MKVNHWHPLTSHWQLQYKHELKLGCAFATRKQHSKPPFRHNKNKTATTIALSATACLLCSFGFCICAGCAQGCTSPPAVSPRTDCTMVQFPLKNGQAAVLLAGKAKLLSAASPRPLHTHARHDSAVSIERGERGVLLFRTDGHLAHGAIRFDYQPLVCTQLVKAVEARQHPQAVAVLEGVQTHGTGRTRLRPT